MNSKQKYLQRYQQGATTTTEKRILTVGEWHQGRPIHCTVVLPHDVIAPAELQAIIMIESRRPQKAGAA